MAYLTDAGFSEQMISQFFKPFMTGIFLEDQLSTSSRMFEFVFKMFSEGDAAIPAKGMGMIPQQLAKGLTSDEITFNERVDTIDGNIIKTFSGSVYQAKYILIATDQLNLPKPIQQEVRSYRSVTNMYFTSATRPFSAPLIALNTLPDKLVNNIAVMDRISPVYSGNGDSLISLSLVGHHAGTNSSDLQQKVIDEMKYWFPQAVHWKHLKTYHIPYALPDDDQVTDQPDYQVLKLNTECFVCGDYLMNGSINAAMKSGRLAAEAIIHTMQ